MQDALRQFEADFFQALAHLTRIAIVEQLRNGELSAGALIERLGVEQANVSQHYTQAGAPYSIDISTPQKKSFTYDRGGSDNGSMMPCEAAAVESVIEFSHVNPCFMGRTANSSAVSAVSLPCYGREGETRQAVLAQDSSCCGFHTFFMTERQ
jgi:hypothetical protein